MHGRFGAFSETSLKHEQLTHRNTHANSIIRTARTAASELEYAVAERHLVDHYQPETLQGIEFASNGDQFSNYSILRVIVVFFQPQHDYLKELQK